MSDHRVLKSLGVAVACLAVGGSAMSVAGYTHSRTDTHTVNLPTGVSALDVTAGPGDVRVRPEAAAGPSAVARLRWAFIKPTVGSTVDGERVSLVDECSFSLFGDCSTSWDLALPQGTPVRVRTTSGDISVDGLDGDLEVDTTSGDVIGGVFSAKRVTVTATSGDVDLRLSTAPESVVVTSTSGSIRLVLPNDGTAYAVQVSTAAGDVTNELVNAPGATHRIVVETTSGDIEVVRG
ncbi:MAG: DUF4097 family beta strand repeat protein [Tetrasphaera sp.]|mgnify:CR=1 FL=1|nr:DUF4097 family beta strand repeat protein [Tetrasphaera sp.]